MGESHKNGPTTQLRNRPLGLDGLGYPSEVGAGIGRAVAELIAVGVDLGDERIDHADFSFEASDLEDVHVLRRWTGVADLTFERFLAHLPTQERHLFFSTRGALRHVDQVGLVGGDLVDAELPFEAGVLVGRSASEAIMLHRFQAQRDAAFFYRYLTEEVVALSGAVEEVDWINHH